MKIKIITFVFLVSLMTSSCVVYYPQTADIPLISKKNDLRVDAGISSMISTNATVSYGLTDNIAIQAYGNVINGYYFHGAVGHYKELTNRKIIEFYGGIGYGYGNAYNDVNP